MRTARTGMIGVTLIEMLVIMVIVGFGMSVAVPSFQGMIVRNRIISQANEVVLAVNLARSEATRTGSGASIVAAAATAADEFGGGYCVVLGTPQNCTTGTVIRRFEPLAGETTLNHTGNASVIVFNRLGGLDGGATEHNIDLCYPGYAGRRLQINLIGRIKSHVEGAPGATVQPSC